MIQIAPSILSADFTRLADAVRSMEEGGADLLHIDIMDGHFVPNLTFGPGLVEAIKRESNLPIDVHLMVDNPREMIPLFQEAGADWISIHLEATAHLDLDISLIKKQGCRAGLVLNPATPLHMMTDILHEVDYVLLMTVNPGWGAQAFIENGRSRIRRLKHWIQGQNLDVEIEIDGGVKIENAARLIEDGADILVIGSGIFKAENPKAALEEIKAIAARANPS
jgi:ribulose-phosphate 3-epimerase